MEKLSLKLVPAESWMYCRWLSGTPSSRQSELRPSHDLKPVIRALQSKHPGLLAADTRRLSPKWPLLQLETGDAEIHCGTDSFSPHQVIRYRLITIFNRAAPPSSYKMLAPRLRKQDTVRGNHFSVLVCENKPRPSSGWGCLVMLK